MGDTYLTKLRDPFPAQDIEWRIQRSGIKNGKPWAIVVAYVSNRAIMDRLDEVCGPENWINEFAAGPDGGVLCGIGVRINDEFLWKWDGAENTNFEPVKGGLSGAMKRAGVQWGIGRYLYNLDASFAEFDENGKYKDNIKRDRDDKHGEWHRWNPPPLPSWALPTDSPPQKDSTHATGNGKKQHDSAGPTTTEIAKRCMHGLAELKKVTEISREEEDEWIDTITSAESGGGVSDLMHVLTELKTKYRNAKAGNTEKPDAEKEPEETQQEIF